MRQQIMKILAQKGQSPVIDSINKTINDFEKLRYSKGEIKETIRDFFFGLDGKIDAYIIEIGY